MTGEGRREEGAARVMWSWAARFTGPGLIFLVVVAVYGSTLDAPFHFDDTRFIVDNPATSDFSYFTDGRKADSLFSADDPDLHRFFRTRYLTYMSFWFNYRLGGLEVAGYHLVNILIHLLSSLLVRSLVLLLFATPPLRGSALQGRSQAVALTAALLFAGHPIQTQAVTYVVQRFASLATLFYLLSLTSYLRFRLARSGSPVAIFLYLVSLAAAAAAMFTKEISFTLPLMLTAAELLFFRGLPRRRLLFPVPHLLTLLIIPVTLMGGDSQVLAGASGSLGATRLHTDLSRGEYLFTQFRVLTTYLKLLVLPVGQNLDHDFPVSRSFFQPGVLFSLSLLMSFAGAALVLFERSRRGDPALSVAAYGILWFFLTSAVESSVIPIKDVIFEHRVYLPSVGFFLFLTAGAALLLLLKIRRPRLRRVLPAAVALLVLSSTAVAYHRNQVWKSGISLWEDVTDKSPRKVRGHNNLANAYLREGRHRDAVDHLLVALELTGDEPRDPAAAAEVHYNIGLAYGSLEEWPKAIEHYRAALGLNPRHASASNNLGVAHFSLGQVDLAFEYYERALRLDSRLVNAYFNLAEAYGARERWPEAVRYFRTFLRYRPDYAEGYYQLGRALEAAGLGDQSREAYLRAVDLDPRHREARRILDGPGEFP